ncbi:MAG: serine hydrolase domain-containing protein [Candidatus Thorarchaeota archaeon]
MRKRSLSLGLLFFFFTSSLLILNIKTDTSLDLSSEFSKINFLTEQNDIQQTSRGLVSPSELEVFLDTYIIDQLNRYNIVGMTISVVKDGGIYFSKGYGYKDSTLITPVDANQTLFRIGSVSKTFTAIAVLQLVEDGILDLDTDVNTYLTDFKIPKTYEEPITLRHLLTHTAGFEEGSFSTMFLSPSYVEPMEELLADFIPDRVHAPGTITSYSNYGFALAGYIVQEMSGINFEQYVEDEILVPLNMNRTTFKQPLPQYLISDMSSGFDTEKTPYGFEYVTIPPAGSCSSTAVDMSKYMIALLNNGIYNGSQILQNDTMQMMQEDQFTPHPSLPSVALGLYELDIYDKHIIGHGGDTIFFHSRMALFPDDDLGVFISYNSQNGVSAKSEFFDVFLSRYFPFAGSAVTPMEGYSKGLKKFSGQYVTTRRFYSDKTINIVESNTTFIYKEKDFLESGFDVKVKKDMIQISGLEIFSFVQTAPNFFEESTGQIDFKIYFINNSKGQIINFYSNFVSPVVSYEKIHPIYKDSDILAVILIIAGSIYLISISGWGIDAFFKRRKGETKQPVILKAARWWMFGMFLYSSISIILLAAKTYDMIVLNTEILIEFPGLLAFSIVDLILIGGAVVFCILSWLDIGKAENKSFWKLFEKIQYTILTGLGFLLLWCFIFWNFFRI